MKITRKTHKELFNAVEFCHKASFTDKSKSDRPYYYNTLEVKNGRLCATDGARLHYQPITDLPNGVYDYSKKGSTITLTKHDNNNYPDIDKVIPRQYAHTVEVNRDELLRICRQALIMVNNHWSCLYLTFNGHLEVKVSNPDLGEYASETETSKVVDPESTVAINPKFIRDVLTSFKSKNVTIKLQPEAYKMPLVLQSGDKTALVMPMRI